MVQLRLILPDCTELLSLLQYLQQQVNGVYSTADWLYKVQLPVRSIAILLSLLQYLQQQVNGVCSTAHWLTHRAAAAALGCCDCM